nr:alpha-2-macroglobulin family protein [Thermoflexibacter sp.]
LSGDNSQSVSIPAGDERQLFFKAKAKNEIGTALINVEASGLGEKFVEKIDMTVRPSTSLLKTSGSGVIEAGKSANIDMKADYIQNSVKGRLIVSRSPVVEFAKSLNYLVMYPYGCVEQTISTAFPQIYFADLIDDVYPAQSGNAMAKQNAYFNVQEAIRKLQTMQLYDGSLSYWQGGDYASWWGTAYAAHFLIEARKAGFEVDTKFLNQIYSYLGGQVKRKETQIYEYYDDGNTRKATRIAPKETFYSLYVLALAGRQDVATMNYYKANQQLMSLDSKYLLATSYYLAGDQAAYRKLLPQAFTGERSVTALGGSFYSYIRDEAIALNSLIETDAQSNQIGIMAKHLAQQMKQAPYLNTQESAFGLLALGKLAKKANESNATATIYADGKEVGKASNKAISLGKQVEGKQVKIDVQGGNLYYFWELEGLNTTGTYKEEDSFLKVRKEFYDRNGNKFSSTNFKQNELVVVKITLQSTGGFVPNVVITDMLPAGLEIDNPRLGGVGVSWITNAAVAEHFDFRDDRVNIFASAAPTEIKSFYYVCRAVSRGTFKMGPVSADAMYSAEYHSYNGAGMVVVE